MFRIILKFLHNVEFAKKQTKKRQVFLHCTKVNILMYLNTFFLIQLTERQDCSQAIEMSYENNGPADLFFWHKLLTVPCFFIDTKGVERPEKMAGRTPV